MSKVFKPMRSVAPDEAYPITWPKHCSRKLDGIRFTVHQGKALSKSGKPIANHHIRNWIEEFMPEGLDGEIISGPPNLETTYGTTFSAVMTHEGTPEFDLYVFDLSDSLTTYASERLAALTAMMAGMPDRVKLVEQTMVTSQAQFDVLYAKYIEEGYEGAILKDPAGFYKYGRSTPKVQTQLKFKPEEDFDAEVTGVYEALENLNEAFTNEVGETKRSTHQENKVGKGMIGGFHATDLLTGLPLRVAAGRMKHDDRIATFNNPELAKGRFLKYRSMTYGQMTNGQPRHGRFIGWRDVTDLSQS